MSLQLEHDWTFYFDEGPPRGISKKEYQSYIKPLGSFNSIQGFWRYWNSIMDIKKLPDNANLRLFKTGIQPMWEDPQCVNGGKWIIRAEKERTETMWSELVLTTIGCQVPHSDEICGLVLSIRAHGNLINVWNKTASAISKNREIEDFMRNMLQADMNYVKQRNALKFNKYVAPLLNNREKGAEGSSPKDEDEDPARASEQKKSKSYSLTALMMPGADLPVDIDAGSSAGVPEKRRQWGTMEERPEDSAFMSAVAEPSAPVQRKWGSRDSTDTELQLKPQVRKWGSRDDSIETEPAFKPPRRKWGSRDDEAENSVQPSAASVRRWGSIEEEEPAAQKTAQQRRWGSIEEESIPPRGDVSRPAVAAGLAPQTSANRFAKPSMYKASGSAADSVSAMRRPSNELEEDEEVADQLSASLRASVDQARQQPHSKPRNLAVPPKRGLDQQTLLIALGLALCIAAVLYQILFL